MSRFKKVFLIGGPLDQWGGNDESGYIDNGDDVVFLGPADSVESGCYVYRRDKDNPLTEDGRDRWVFDEHLTEQALMARKLIGPEAPKPTILHGSDDEELPEGMEKHVIELKHSVERDRWELFYDGELVQTAPTNAIRNREQAEAFRAEHIAGDAQLVKGQ
jgi:hypothetical protein